MKRLLLVPILLLAGAAGSSTTATGAALAAPVCHTVNTAYPPRPYVHMKPAGRMVIGKIGLNTPVFQAPNIRDVQNESSRSLDKGPAFYPKYMKWHTGRVNSLPGQGGTVAMLGHRTTRTHPFCLVRDIRPRKTYITLKVRYGTFKYLVVANLPGTPGSDWYPFEHPEHYDRHPKTWHKGVKPEYLVFGACDPPGSDTYRDVIVAKLITEFA